MILDKLNVMEKITAIIAFVFIILALLIISVTPPAKCYEISVYDAYPWYFWFFIITSIFLGQLIVIKDVFSPASNKNDRSWLLGFIAIVIPIIILLFIPYFRGYLTYGRGDHLTHIGIVKDILWTGKIANNDLYPNLHILTSSLAQMCDCDVVIIANFISRFFFFLSPVSLYLFFKTFFKKENETKFALVLASSFLFFGSFSNYLAQCPQSFLIMPLILYLYFKRIKSEGVMSFSILFIVFITGYIFYHPLNSLLLTIVLISVSITLHIYQKINGKCWINDPKGAIEKKAFNSILFPIFLFFVWYFSFSSIIKSFNKVFSSIFVDHSTGSFFERQSTAMSTYNPEILDIIKLAAYEYGAYLIISLVSIFSLIYIFNKWYKNKERNELRFSLLFSGLSFFIFGVLSAVAFFADVIVGWGRFIRWAVFFSFILISLLFCVVISDSKYSLYIQLRNGIYKFPCKSSGKILVCIILISLLFLSTFTFYRAPENGDINQQVTNMEWNGMNWLLDYRNEKNLIEEFRINQLRFSDAIHGRRENTLYLRTEDLDIPDHFNYDNKTNLGNYYNGSRYIIITHLGRVFYPKAYPSYVERWRFTPEDFDKLQSDNALIRIYTNSNLDVFLTEAYCVKG